MFVTLRYASNTTAEKDGSTSSHRAVSAPPPSIGFEEALTEMENYSESYKSLAPGICPPNDPRIEENWLANTRIVSDRLSLLKETYKAIQAAKRRLQASRTEDSSLPAKPTAANDSSPDLDDIEHCPEIKVNPTSAASDGDDDDENDLTLLQHDSMTGLAYSTTPNIDSATLANLLQQQVSADG